MKDGWHMGQGHNFVVHPGSTAYLTSRNLSFKVEIRYLPCRSVRRTRVDVCGRSRKGLITLWTINNSKHYPWFPPLGLSHRALFCPTTFYTLDTQSVVLRPSATPAALLEKQTVRLHPRATDSEFTF